MEKEQVAVDEAVETVAEENARAYSKTVWDESTPITADKLNKIENGIANALDTTTGGTVKGKLTVKGNIQLDDGNLYSNKNGGNKAVIEVFGGDKNGSAVAYSGGALTVLAGGESGSLVVQNTNNTEEYAVVSADQGVKLYANLQNGWDNRKTVEFTPGGRFKLNNNSLELSPNNSGYARMGLDGDTQDVYISNINNNWFRLKGDKTITYAGNKVYTAFDKPTAEEIGALPLSGGTLSGNIVLNNDKALGGKNTSGTAKWLAWVDRADRANFGDTGLKSVINSSVNPEVNISGIGVCTLYHTGNKPTPSDIGAAPASHTHNYLPLTGGTVSGETVFTNYLSVKAWPNYGTGTAQMWYDGNNKLLNIQNAEGLKAGSHRVATWEGNPTHYMFRYGSGLGGANGYITFSY